VDGAGVTQWQNSLGETMRLAKLLGETLNPKPQTLNLTSNP